MVDAIAPDKKDSVVKEKQMEALKRLGHTELKLDEYERMLWMQWLADITLTQSRRQGRKRSHSPR
jgi:hypothetical protein